MKTFKFKRVSIEYCEIEAPDVDAALGIIYAGDADWSDGWTCEITEVEDADN